MTDIAELGLAVNTKPVEKASTVLTNFKKVSKATNNSVIGDFNRTKAAVKNLIPPLEKAKPAMKGFGHQARMVSMQLSQVAQQGSATGNYLQALAIQLPDLMLGFGTLGILIGAAAGALGSYFVTSARKAENASSELSEEIDTLGESFKDLGVAQKELLRLKIAEEAMILGKSIQSLNDDLKKNVTEFDSLSRALNRGSIDSLEYAERTDEITRANKDIRAEIERHKKTIKERNDLLNQTAEKEEAAAEAAEKAADARAKLQASLMSVEQGLENPIDRAIRQAQESLSVINEAERQKIASIKTYDQLRIDNAQALSDKLVQIEKQTAAQNSQILTGSQEKSLGHTANFFGNLASIAKEGGEEQFQRYKNLASAQAAISAALAVTSVLGDATIPTAVRIPLAFSIGALAAVQVAQIQGQEYQGARAMGGQVQGGGRYLVGENGPEVLQLGSQGGNVTPNHALGGGAPPITTVFQISTGVAETAQAEIMRAVPMIQSIVKQTVMSESRKGGSFSRAVGAR